MMAHSPSVDLRRLRYFVAVCTYGGFSHAAGYVGIAQSALTRQVKLLESELGVTLIKRNGRGAEPTDEGRFLLERASGHLNALDEAVSEIRLRETGASDNAVLGVCPTIAPHFVEALRQKLALSEPGISLSVIEAYSGDLRSLLENNRLDLSLTYKPSAPGVDAVDLYSEKLVLVSGHVPGAPARSYTMSELEGLKLILPSRTHDLRLIIDAACKQKGILLRPELELDSLEAVKSLLDKRPVHYFTILPEHSLRGDVEGRRFSLFRIDNPAMYRTITIVAPQEARNPAVTARLRRHIEEQAAAIKGRLANVF